MTAMAIAEVSQGVRNVTGDLTPGEARHLTMLEKRIERGLQTFREVGEALLEIRDNRLFRVTHATFESYCNDRWNMARNRAYQLMGAAQVAQVLGPAADSVVNEAQARELVPLLHTDPKLVPKVMAAVRESGKPITAPAIRKAVQVVSGNGHVAEPPSPTIRLVSRLGAVATEYVEWSKSRPTRTDKAKVREAFDRLCALVGT